MAEAKYMLTGDVCVDLSIVIPCYCSGQNIIKVLNELDDILKDLFSYEVILVNDGSPDDTFEIISHLAKSRDNTIAVNLARNSGQHAALMAGFHFASGEYVATCEDDGQTDITLLPELITKLKEGYDIAAPRIEERGKRSFFRKVASDLAATTAKWMIPRPDGIYVPIFFAARKFIIDEIVQYKYPYPYLEGLILRSTYNVALIPSRQRERIEGKSGYTFKKLLSLWLNGFTSFSIKPLRISAFVGFLSSFAGVFAGIIVIIRKLIFENIATGWSSIISVILFMSGLILFSLGVIGEYIGRIYLSINQTPQYVIRDIVKKENGSSRDDY